ncbi:MAG: hypothetical protein N838_24235 [Thiohalocapsa sp. PB-PSB1]|jgi:LysR family glycine cleavage system transcriptional activator|nr:MAG: hypothetical protein N838_24235 [Thiohalocapsa sp. PB-PSB1]MBL4543796.1 transcriptional regulator GcvA [Paracoccaceae bacterium]
MRSLRQINLNSLRVLESAARLGSFTRAAEENLISPSAVSQRIKALEAQLQFQVFERRPNTVALTPKGEEFLVHVQEALATILAAGLHANGQDREQMLSISILPTFGTRWLLPRLATFDDAHPDLRLHISQSYNAVDFAREDVDLAIRYGNGRFPGLESTLLMQEDLLPVLSPQLLDRVLPGRRIEDLQPRDLTRFTLLHSATCHLNWRSWFRFAGVPDAIDRARSMSFDSCMLTFEAANAGLGVAVANRAYVAQDIRAGRLIAPFRIQHPNSNGWHVVYPRGHGHRHKIAAFRDWIIAEAAEAREIMDTTFKSDI